jgi:hypothetical protein
MRKALVFALVSTVSFLLVSCFNITVNVYFPEKDVKSAFKSLEQQLMKGGEGESPAQPGGAPPAQPDGAPGGTKPQGRLDFELGARPAYAQGTGELSAELADKLRNDPEVVKAYKGMGERLGYINRLRDQGVLGEGSDGLLKPRGSLGKKETLAMEEENADRTAVINAMAKAIVELNNQPVNKSTIGQVLGKAGEQFADVRREAAKPGWWIQKPDGSWVKK